jgi:hypothetical protein
VDASIERLFTTQWRGRVRRFGGFQTRLTLAIAMGVVDPKLEPAIRRLAGLRNRFAHGSEDVIPDEESRAIALAAGTVLEQPSQEEWSAQMERLSPADRLRDAIYVVRWTTEKLADQMHEFRRDSERLYFDHAAN